MKKNICVVGAGYWGKNHIKTLHQLNSLKGVVEINDHSLKHLSKEYPEQVKKMALMWESWAKKTGALPRPN